MEFKTLIETCCLGFILAMTGCVTNNPNTEPSEANGAAQQGKSIATGTILHQVPPLYPPLAKAARVEGIVVLHAIIAADGSVESLDAISGPVMLRTAAIDAVKQWVYAPYILNGVPRRVDTTVKVEFRIPHDPNKGR